MVENYSGSAYAAHEATDRNEINQIKDYISELYI
jgi:hypothetical protein